MPRSALFEPIKIRSLSLNNRIAIAPMCQYSAVDGCMNDWHLVHLGGLSLSGAAMLTIEATAVVPEGRITYADLGLWNDRTYSSMSLVVESIRRWSSMPIGIQLSHAGRKGSTEVPWKGGRQLPPTDGLGWQTLAPSRIPYRQEMVAPLPLDRQQMKNVRDGFAAAAIRAARLGLDFVQIDVAHGYLLHQFLSPLTNRRDDEYGGSLNNRMRYPLEVLDVVRSAFPAQKPVSVRLSATDWFEGGWQEEQSLAFAYELQKRGCDVIDVSSGGLHPDQKMALEPSYPVPFARALKSVVQIPIVAVGLITDFDQAEAIIGTGDADMIALARAILFDPRWPWHAAAHLGGKVRAPLQYLRSEPIRFRGILEPDFRIDVSSL